MLLGRESKQNVVNAAWVDSWHMSDKPMICTGAVDDDTGAITVRGDYAAPPDPTGAGAPRSSRAATRRSSW
jgi:hypothetical protein